MVTRPDKSQQSALKCWLGMLGLKHLLFASEIEPEGTERLLQHLANTGSEDGASGAEPEQGERKRLRPCLSS